MNAEIHKYNARQAVEDLEKQHGENATKALHELARKSYKRNLLYNPDSAGAIVNAVFLKMT